MVLLMFQKESEGGILYDIFQLLHIENVFSFKKTDGVDQTKQTNGH